MSVVHRGYPKGSESRQDGCSEVALVTVSMDLGAGRRGVDMGPSAIRIAGLRDRLEALGYRVVEAGTVTARGPEVTGAGESRARFLTTIAEVCSDVHALVSRALQDGCLPLILGGDHSLAIGSVSAVADHHRSRGEGIGVLWIDAHTDMNTPGTTLSGNVHGMCLAVLTGRGADELVGIASQVPAVTAKNVCIVGARSIDESEKEVVLASGVRVITMSEIDERGMSACMDEALARVMEGTAGFHLSFDLDVLDPMVAPGVGTPVPGGLTFREAHLVCEKAAKTGGILGLEIVELNPVLDAENRTGSLAVGLVASALGKAIL